MNRTAIIRLSIIVLVGVGLCFLVYFSDTLFFKKDKPPKAARLKTGGTSVVYIIMENRWKTEYRKAKEGIEVEYDSTGSNVAFSKMLDKDYAISFLHAPLTGEQKKKAQEKGGEVVQIPVVICAVVPVYNLKYTLKEAKDKPPPPLNFTGEVLANIFLGNIKKWNDPAIEKLNMEVDLPDTEIKVVHREDSSGTTLLFTDYLQQVSPTAWLKEMGPAKSEMKWRAGVGKARNEGVARHVKMTEGAIGYVDLVHAEGSKLQYGAVKNLDKKFVHADAGNMTATVKGQLAQIPEDLTFDLTNKPGGDSYPICGVIWAVCYQNQPVAKKQEVVDFLHWVLHGGQKFAAYSAYAPLPDELVQRADQMLKSIKSIQ